MRMFHGHSSQQVFVARDEVTFSGFAGIGMIMMIIRVAQNFLNLNSDVNFASQVSTFE